MTDQSKVGGPTAGQRKLSRDNRIDLVRGFALVSIFINHMPGNWLGGWTTRNFGFSDAAELFVLLAGYSAGLAFYPFCERKDYFGLAVKASRRVLTLYGAHLATTLAATLLFIAVIALSSRPEPADLIGVAPFFSNPAAGVAAVLAGRFQLSYFNILPMYVVFVAILPLILVAGIRDLRLLGLLSGLAYVATNVLGVEMPGGHQFDSWFFNPIAWQGLFAIGVGLAIARFKGQDVAFNRYVYALAAGFLVLGALRPAFVSGALEAPDGIPDWMVSLQKPNLPLPRLLHVLALAYVVGQSPIWRWLKRVPAGFVLTRLGRHSLPVFVAGSFLSMVGWVIVHELDGGMAVQTLVAAAGIAAMALLAWGLDARRAVKSANRRATSLVVATPHFAVT